MDDVYFIDTNSFIEILKGNEKYVKFLEKGILTNKFVLTELFYHLNKEVGEEKANQIIDQLIPFCQEIGFEIIKEAVLFKKENRKFSLLESINYIMARKLKAKLLTNNKNFESMEVVEYIKG